MIRALRLLAGAVSLAVGLLGVSYLQSRFDGSDLKKAVAVVETKIPEAVSCEAELLSRVKGLVRVRCLEPGREFLVDVVRGTMGENNVHSNEAGR